MKNTMSELEKYDLLVLSIKHECASTDIKLILKLRALKEVYNALKNELDADFIKNGKNTKLQ